jgi:hypothetical protein
MTPFRKITLTAKNDRSVFTGTCHFSGEWVVLSLDDTEEFDLGQTITGCLDCSDGGDFFRTVQNESAGCSVRVCIENWGLRWDGALGFLNRLGSPTSITVLESRSHGLVPQTYAV